jgi:prolyl-tRNA synthetase
MRSSQLFTKTKKDAPADEVSKNAQLLIRAGYIHKEMAGVYTFLPLGLRVLDNISQVIREEMDAIGANEMKLTSLQDADIWKQTDRWDDKKVDVWFKTKLKNGTELGLAPTHEEPITRAVKPYVNSYKDLPFMAYQIQTKLRNETRAKSGVMRGREFLMKDLYSFARNEQEHQLLYDKIAASYERVFERLGIGDKTFKTFASGGMFSKFSHEYQTLVDAGEDEIYYDEVDKQYLNKEVVAAKVGIPNEVEEPKALEEHDLHGVVGVEALVKAFGIKIEKSTKAIFFITDTDELVMAVVRSDYSIDEAKLADVLGAKELTAAPAELILKQTGAEVGYAGLINAPDIRIVYDDSLDGLSNFETGSNKTGYHSINVNFGRDTKHPENFVDIKVPKKGDINPKNNKPFPVYAGAEVGNIFTLKDKFSGPLGLTFVDEDEKIQNVYMGSYGIGPSRLVGVITEALGDEKGLVWPENIAPYVVYLARLGEDENVVKAADNLYSDLEKSGITVLYDDRDARAGEKFKDADLLGMPWRAVVSAKTVEQGLVEVKKRTEAESALITTEEFKNQLQKLA